MNACGATDPSPRGDAACPQRQEGPMATADTPAPAACAWTLIDEPGPPVSILDYLPCFSEGEGRRVLVSPEEWATILRDCDERTDDADDFLDMLEAGLRLAVGRAGVDAQDVSDPRVAERIAAIREAPDFVRDADLSLEDKYALARATADVPADVLLEAKRRACRILEERALVLAGRHPSLAAEPPEKRREVVATWRALTAQAAVAAAVRTLAGEHREALLADLLEDPDRLARAVAERLGRAEALAGAEIGERPAGEVLERRLREMPRPELVLLAATTLGAPDPVGRWLRAARESDLKDSTP